MGREPADIPVQIILHPETTDFISGRIAFHARADGHSVIIIITPEGEGLGRVACEINPSLGSDGFLESFFQAVNDAVARAREIRMRYEKAPDR